MFNWGFFRKDNFIVTECKIISKNNSAHRNSWIKGNVETGSYFKTNRPQVSHKTISDDEREPP